MLKFEKIVRQFLVTAGSSLMGIKGSYVYTTGAVKINLFTFFLFQMIFSHSACRNAKI